jgi:phenylacetate-coenzyme A ligase PaaK-like adenylate-forming protein
MKFDFSKYPINSRAYSERPMAFLDIGPSKILGGIIELALIETGNRAARERWQKAQLRNLLTHASQRSSFWRNRIGTQRPDSKLAALPILTRAELRQQIEQEGSLLRPTDGLQTFTHATSGSSGIPVQFHLSHMNAQYNDVRYLAQDFIDGKDLSMNRTRFKTAKASAAKELATIPSGFTVEQKPSWLGEIGKVFDSGGSKYIECLNPKLRDLVRELRKDPVGRLVANPRMVSAIVSYSGAKLLRELRVSEWVAFGEAVDPDLHRAIVEQGIPIRSTYTSEEVGPIAIECEATPGHYHVATSNVIVEVGALHEIEGKKLGQVLVTHLHSYATPFIRYDLGDLALLGERCPCGHDGPTIHSLFGRVTNTLKHRDGTRSPFFIRGHELEQIVTFTDFRVRQPSLDAIIMEIGGRETLTSEEIGKITAFLKARSGDEFEIDVIARSAIDWGDNIKRQSFRCEI